MSSPALSLCMIVKNEERRLERCLDSVSGLDAEIVVIDTGSTDATGELAARFGAKVRSFDFSIADFAAARNYGLGRASGRWILVLDADETLDPATLPLIRDIIESDANAGYYLERRNWQTKGEPKKDYALRLFPNRPHYRYRGRVHETVDASILAGGGRLLRSGIRIDHDFASDAEARRRRNLWYIEILNEEIAADPGDTGRLDFLAAEYHQLGMLDQATAIAEQIARLRPQDPRAHLNAGVYHLLHQQDRQRARADFMKALHLQPGHLEAKSFLALT